MFLTSTKHLPQELTSYDFLKSFALITMIIDHIGFYFFPEQNEWRAIGRMSMPVWLFLIGYAQSRDLSKLLWIGGFILLFSDFVIGESIFAINILFTILFVRFSLDFIMEIFFKDRESMFFMTALLVLFVIPTSWIFEYGTQAFLFAMFGYLVRHQKTLQISSVFILIFMGVAVIHHAIEEQIVFGFNIIEATLSAAGILGTCLYMMNFKPQIYATLSASFPSFVSGFFKLMGRHSLEIYVLHLLIFKFIAFGLFSAELNWFQWHLF